MSPSGRSWRSAHRTPNTEHHLAPVIVAAWPAVTQHNPTHPFRLALGGLAMAVIASLLLAAGGHLGGPSLLPRGGPLAESIVASGLGGLAGWIVGLFRDSGRVAVQT